MSSAASTSTRRPARTKAAAARSSVPGCARTRRRSTRCSTTRSANGWNATGRSTRSSTRHGPDPGPSAGLACQLPGREFQVTRRRSACHRTTSGSRSVTHNAGLGTPSLIRTDSAAGGSRAEGKVGGMQIVLFGALSLQLPHRCGCGRVLGRGGSRRRPERLGSGCLPVRRGLSAGSRAQRGRGGGSRAAAALADDEGPRR